jgi:cold shock CspA family protein
MYHDPRSVLSPKGRVKSVEVVFDKGAVPESWSVAQIEWDDHAVVGIRWNGDSVSHKGLPQARGNPAWFILPEDIGEAVLVRAKELQRNGAESLLDGYRQMAADQEQEAEAEEWTEGLIGDAY